MSNFNQELKEILPINSKEKLDTLFKLMSRRRTVITPYIDKTIFKYLTDTILRNKYCIRTGRILSVVLSNIAAIEEKHKKTSKSKNSDEKKVKYKTESISAKESFTTHPVVPKRMPVVQDSVYKQGRVSHQRIGHDFVPDGPRLQKNGGLSSLKLDWAKVFAIGNSANAVNKITPEQRAAAESYKPNPEVSRITNASAPQSAEKVKKTGTSIEQSEAPKSVPCVISHNREKESLIEIVEELEACETARRKVDIFAVARVHCIYDGNPKTFWFTNKIYKPRELSSLNVFGRFVPKYADIAIRMQRSAVGKSFDYSTINIIKKLEVHSVRLDNKSDLQNHTISIAGDKLTYQYRNLAEFLYSLRENQKNIRVIEAQLKDIEEKNDDNKSRTEKSKDNTYIAELQKKYRILTQQQEDLKNITIYIRKQGEMRYSHIVDPIQTGIMSENLFDGETIIIKGGPGTGKTTTMIHRLAYLTDTFAIKEDDDNKLNKYKINSVQRKQLLKAIKEQRDWMFFSPSQMLKEYLAQAMKKEGLTNTSDKVWYWKDYCRIILQDYYHLIDAEGENAPFKVCHLTGTLFYQNSDIVNAFTNFYLEQLRKIKKQLPEIKTHEKVFKWTAIAQKIKEMFDEVDNYDLAHFVSLFISLESIYGNDCKSLLSEKNEYISVLADKICNLLDENKEVKASITDIFELSFDIESSENTDVEVIDDEEETDESGGIRSKLQKLFMPLRGNKQDSDPLSAELQKWLKSYCYSKVSNEDKLSDEQKLVEDSLLPLIENKFDDEINKIGELMIFERYAQYTKGVRAIMLNVIPSRYKKFRSYLNKSQYKGCDQKLLRDIMQRRQGKELHHQEQSLLLGFINTLVKQIKSTTKTEIKHNYIAAYEEVARPIIGVDEATDFSVCDIYAMQSLLTSDFNSFTLCGDMMQRMTSFGIKSWSELDDVLVNPHPVEMKTSYRQSKKLLEVAKNLYLDTLGESPVYKAYMKSNKVPAPLAYIEENELYKVDWISKRIAEVYRAYGEQLPSIAIFVTDKGYVPRFVNNLQGTDFFKEKGVKVLDGTKEESTQDNHICVYPINMVKGMEFDVVFFHNIDQSDVEEDLLKRYIYVGVSRAAFFLGITMNKDKSSISKYFEKNKDWFTI